MNRYEWTQNGMAQAKDGDWIAADYLDCRTCRNFRGTQHCHSILRCTNGSSYQRGGIVQLWELTEEDAGF